MTKIENDLNIPTFLKRLDVTPPAATAADAKAFAEKKKDEKIKTAKTAIEQINQARKKDGLRPYAPAKAAAAVVSAVAKPPEKRSADEKTLVNLAVQTAKAPKKAGKLVAAALKQRNELAEKAKSISAANGKTPVKAKAKKSGRYDWTGAEEAAAKGTIPTTPDFSANTHKCYRPRLAEIEKLVKKGDVKALKAMKDSDFRKDGSPLIMNRYRKLAITALEAKRAR